MTESKSAVEYLTEKDPPLGKLIRFVFEIDENPLEVRNSTYYESLVGSVVSQQLSNIVSKTIMGRIRNLVPNHCITPESISSLDIQSLRECGLSKAKASYIQGIAETIMTGDLVFEEIAELSDEDVLIRLQKIRGIGKWTAEMFLIFQLNRQNIFPNADAGIRSAMVKLYGLNKQVSVGELDNISENWSPYKSIASRFLWKGLDGGYFKGTEHAK